MAEPDAEARRVAWIRQTLKQYEKPLTRYVGRILSDHDRAQDVVQDAFFKLLAVDDWQALAPKVKAWLYRVCRNRAFDLMKKDRPMRHATQKELSARPDGSPDPAAISERKQAASLLVGLIAELPAKQKEVVRLKFEEGLSYREISEVTGQSVTNVGYLLHRGISALREGMRSAEEVA
jgi:RNA polymerase sigma factor (sigma-70 family)